MNIKTLKVIGMEEIVHAVCGDNGDSYATHIEDKIGNTAPFAFVIGDGDMRQLVEVANGIPIEGRPGILARVPVRAMLRVYFEVENESLAKWLGRTLNLDRIGKLLVCDYDHVREMRALHINDATIENIGDLMDLGKWISTLPYQELLA